MVLRGEPLGAVEHSISTLICISSDETLRKPLEINVNAFTRILPDRCCIILAMFHGCSTEANPGCPAAREMGRPG